MILRTLKGDRPYIEHLDEPHFRWIIVRLIRLTTTGLLCGFLAMILGSGILLEILDTRDARHTDVVHQISELACAFVQHVPDSADPRVPAFRKKYHCAAYTPSEVKSKSPSGSASTPPATPRTTVTAPPDTTTRTRTATQTQVVTTPQVRTKTVTRTAPPRTRTVTTTPPPSGICTVAPALC